ncbi:MAG: response regulator [Cytophagaceae bacterium]
MKKILLIDDDGINNFINERLFRKLNIAGHIEIRRNGREALDYLRRMCQDHEECPELIVIDINMPEMNGFEFLEAFHKLDILNKHHSRIIMLSTSTNRRDVERLKEMNLELVRKPLNEEKIRDLMNEAHAYHGYN